MKSIVRPLLRAARGSLAGASLVAVVAFTSVVHATACGDTSSPVLCKDIPDGGCPLSHGVACDDPACAAAYACFEGKWSLDHTCPARDAGPADANDEGATDASPPPRDAGFDVPPGASGGPGCADLLPPDCPLATVIACPSNRCCGCEDLFVCADGGWSTWGACGDGGTLTRALSSP